MKRLIIAVCIILIASAGMALSGCKGGGQIEGPGAIDTTAAAGDELDVAEQTDLGAQAQTCIPAGTMPTSTTSRVVDKDDPAAEFPCLMNYAPDSDLKVRIDERALSLLDLIRDKAKLDDKTLAEFDRIEMLFSNVSEIVAFASLEMVKKDMAANRVADFEPLKQEQDQMTEGENREVEEGIEMTDADRAAMANQAFESEKDEAREKPEAIAGGFLLRARPGVDITALVDGDVAGIIEGLNEKSEKDAEQVSNVWQAKVLDERTLIVSRFAESIEKVEGRVAAQLSSTCQAMRFDGSAQAPAIYAVLNGKSKIFDPQNIDTPELKKIISLVDSRRAVAGIDFTGGVFYAYAGAITDDNKPITYLAYYLDTTDQLIDNFIKALSEKMQKEKS